MSSFFRLRSSPACNISSGSSSVLVLRWTRRACHRGRTLLHGSPLRERPSWLVAAAVSRPSIVPPLFFGEDLASTSSRQPSGTSSREAVVETTSVFASSRVLLDHDVLSAPREAASRSCAGATPSRAGTPLAKLADWRSIDQRRQLPDSQCPTAAKGPPQLPGELARARERTAHRRHGRGAVRYPRLSGRELSTRWNAGVSSSALAWLRRTPSACSRPRRLSGEPYDAGT
jgi:hypothetical protein